MCSLGEPNCTVQSYDINKLVYSATQKDVDTLPYTDVKDWKTFFTYIIHLSGILYTIWCVQIIYRALENISYTLMSMSSYCWNMFLIVLCVF